MENFPKNKNIVLFDGFCNLCTGSVQYIIKKDTEDLFRFASLQSSIGKKLLCKHGINQDQVGSIVLITPENKAYQQSTAALKIAGKLKGVSWMRMFLVLPRFIRDFVYKIIAENRYKWFGKKDECMIPTPELKGKFLES